MDLAQLACPLCGGAFQVDTAWQGQQVACPHCEQAVTVPPLPPASAPGSEPPDPQLAESQLPELQLPVIRTEPEKPAEPARAAQPQADTVAESKPSPVDALLASRREPDADSDSPLAVRPAEQELIDARGEKVPLRRRTPSEQARYRFRLHLTMAALGAVILAALFFVLLKLAG